MDYVYCVFGEYYLSDDFAELLAVFKHESDAKDFIQSIDKDAYFDVYITRYALK